MARPIELDDLTAQRIVGAVRKGMPWKLAAQLGGVGASTLREWKARGRAGEEPFAAFLARVNKAEAERAEDALEVIESAAKDGTWTAAAWLLERRHPKLFALRKPREEALAPMTPEEAHRLVDEAAALKAAK